LVWIGWIAVVCHGCTVDDLHRLVKGWVPVASGLTNRP
jgi:hypothetical protein